MASRPRSFLPIAFSPFERENFGGMYNNSVVARLKPGVTVRAGAGRAGVANPGPGGALSTFPARLAAQLSLPMRPFADEIVGAEPAGCCSC